MTTEHKRRALDLFAIAAFTTAIFPAIYMFIGFVLPASQTIELPSNVAHGAHEQRLDADAIVVSTSDSLTFSESLSLPKARDERNLIAGAYRLTRHPNPLLTELSIALSLLAAGAGWFFRSRTISKRQ
ncbi:hypothetical protein HFP89_04135 [Wenzhouxiangella sp. XN79A]|uniref:hypothetical protein n=1 Tax=Wenzhouxiangella sp. XN79A TaxID=2724193 RepID=UPI00144A5F35|nr:hypothetical protein [Wenzhouxiangella sp. XN79A]NKI34348.1 hypothetical protein [Wenzhouxiangella sp. XN79A]